MILSCNSCEKKFVVPDNAIRPTGRLVQCSSCGNKWTQFPVNKEIKTQEKTSKDKPLSKKIQKFPITNNNSKASRRKIRKKTGPNLYSPEYLAKKHGIKISENTTVKSKLTKDKKKVSFEFYSFLIVSIVVTIFVLRLLYFTQDIIVEKFPILEIYINYLFESIRNIKEIIQNFIAGY